MRAQDGAALALPPADSSGFACALESLIGTCVEYFVSVHWRHGRGAEETKVGVHPGGDGAFTLTLPVPADAAYGSTALQPQLWMRGGTQGKIERAQAKLDGAKEAHPALEESERAAAVAPQNTITSRCASGFASQARRRMPTTTCCPAS